MGRELIVVAAVNNPQILGANLRASPAIASGKLPLHVETGHPSASIAYNAAIDAIGSQTILFAHQDVFLPSEFERVLAAALDELEQADPKWGLAGLIGLNTAGQLTGEVWDCRGRVGRRVQGHHEAVALDELLLVLNPRGNLGFDRDLPAFHLYAADMIQIVRQHGMRSYVLDCPVVHNSPAHGQLDRTWDLAYRYMQRKWRAQLPIPGLIMPITRTVWPVWRRRLGVLKRELFRGKSPRTRHPQPAEVARQLEYGLPVNKAISPAAPVMV